MTTWRDLPTQCQQQNQHQHQPQFRSVSPSVSQYQAEEGPFMILL